MQNYKMRTFKDVALAVLSFKVVIIPQPNLLFCRWLRNAFTTLASVKAHSKQTKVVESYTTSALPDFWGKGLLLVQ